MPHALVIGAGPAGALAATLLARDGRWRVTVCEQSAFPRDKVCGECVSALGVEVLGRAGLAGVVRGLGAVEMTHATLYARDGASARIGLGRVMWGVSRAKLDVALLEATRAAGASVTQPARCERLSSDEGGVRAVVRDLRTNAVEDVRAEVALLADGKGALLPTRRPPTADFGVKTHFRNVTLPRDQVGLFSVGGDEGGHYGGVAPVEGDRVNAAFSVPAGLLQRYRGNVAALFAEVVRSNRALARAFEGAERAGEWLASPLPRFAVAGEWPVNVIPLGNAAAALEPIGGEGMGLALRSAELAVEALIRGRLDAGALRGEFDRLWRVRRAACRGAAMALSAPGMGAAVVELLRVNEGLGRVVMGLMGKPIGAGNRGDGSVAWC